MLLFSADARSGGYCLALWIAWSVDGRGRLRVRLLCVLLLGGGGLRCRMLARLRLCGL